MIVMYHHSMATLPLQPVRSLRMGGRVGMARHGLAVLQKAEDGVYNFYLCSGPGSMAFTWDRSNLNEEGR